jgi:hypothetical protein
MKPPPNQESSRRINLVQSESSNERVSRLRGSSVDDEWGRSESVDPDNVGDIADEGIAHRG